jgi:CheY-like chemotaxis protein
VSKSKKETARVLLIDDDHDFLRITSFWLQSKGYEVVTVEDGKQALKRVQKEEFDAIFLDFCLPGMDGIEVLRRIRETEEDLPIILVTAYPDPDSITRAKKFNISGYFPKTSPFEQLASIVDVVLRTHKGLKI